MARASDFSVLSPPGVVVALNRKERRRLAAQTRQPAKSCSCCRPKDAPALAEGSASEF